MSYETVIPKITRKSAEVRKKSRRVLLALVSKGQELDSQP